MIFKVELDDNGDWIVPIPNELIADGRFREGDEVEIKSSDERIEIINLSCKALPVSRVKRNLNSIMRRLYDHNNYLNRILVTRQNKPSVWICLTAEERKGAGETKESQ